MRSRRVGVTEHGGDTERSEAQLITTFPLFFSAYELEPKGYNDNVKDKE